MKIGILLSGCGVYDGAEIQESVLAMLAVMEAGHTYQCLSVDAKQHHVINHITGKEMDEKLCLKFLSILLLINQILFYLSNYIYNIL